MRYEAVALSWTTAELRKQLNGGRSMHGCGGFIPLPGFKLVGVESPGMITRTQRSSTSALSWRLHAADVGGAGTAGRGHNHTHLGTAKAHPATPMHRGWGRQAGNRGGALASMVERLAKMRVQAR